MAIFHTAFGDFNLELVDAFQHDQLAFNQADSYALNLLQDLFQTQKLEPNGSRISIINDQHGALSTALSIALCTTLSPDKLSIFHDAASFSDALEKNLRLNGYKETHSILPYSAICERPADIALVKLPKNLLLFQYILDALSHSTKTVIVSGMQKYWPKNFYQAAYDRFDSVEVLPGVKKAKAMVLQQPKTIQPVQNFRKSLLINEFQLKLENHAGVFSYDKLDIGSRFFLENFPTLNDKVEVLDLASGNGILGIYAQKHYNAKLTYVDDSQIALDSCMSSLAANGIGEGFRLYHNNCLNDLGFKQQFDAVLCNPPFHQQHSISDHIAKTMVQQSKQALKKTGKIYLIGNRHLGYHKVLKQHFNHLHIVGETPKFTLFEAY
jgi:16S rRNA G1207 methylase RsmC